jgi:hypothetical protein
MDWRNESMFLQISYTIPASLVKIHYFSIEKSTKITKVSKSLNLDREVLSWLCPSRLTFWKCQDFLDRRDWLFLVSRQIETPSPGLKFPFKQLRFLKHEIMGFRTGKFLIVYTWCWISTILSEDIFSELLRPENKIKKIKNKLIKNFFFFSLLGLMFWRSNLIWNHNFQQRS